MGLFKWFAPVKFQAYPGTYKFSFRAKIATLWIIAAIVLFFLFYFAHILPVFIWAAITAYLFSPLVNLLNQRTRLPKAVWITALYIVLAFVLYFTFQAIAPLISNEISDLASGSMEEPTTFLGRIASQGNFSVLGLDISLREQVNHFSQWVRSQLPQQAFPIIFGAAERIIILMIFFVVTFYFILESGNFVERFKAIVPHPYKQEISDLLDNMNLTLGAYIRAQVVLIIVMSVASFIILSLLKIKFAIILSLTTGILEVIPIAGPIAATAIAAIVALFQVSTPFGIPNLSLATIIIIAYFGLRQMEDYFIIPNVASKFVKVHPVAAIFALLVGGTIGGVLGLFLAIPTAAILKVFSEYIYLKLIED